jgi:hypothetical protein
MRRGQARQDGWPAPPTADDLIGMAWWNNLSKKDRRHWMRLAGDTGRAVDAWRAFKGLRLTEKAGPREVLTELFREELIPNPDLLADLVVARLGERGFIIFERSAEPRAPN